MSIHPNSPRRSRCFPAGESVRFQIRPLPALLVVASSLCISPLFAAGGVTDLGVMSGGSISQANGVSADGSVVVGVGSSARYSSGEAFRWTQAGGMVGLGVLSGGNESYANGVSADGSVVVGYGGSARYSQEAFRWTQATGMVGLGVLNGGSISQARGVSADGSVVVGGSNSASYTYEAFRWTQATGMVGLGVLSGGSISQAAGVSGDGSVVVGSGSSASYSQEAFRWTQATGMVGLGVMSGGSFSRARGVSADGSVVAGEGDSARYGQEAFRWTQADGMVGLGGLSGGSYSYANGVSADGSVVVGTGDSANGAQGFRWTQATGMQSVEQWLTANGVAVTGALTQSANATNRDGSVVVGQLRNGNAYIARVTTGLSGLIDTVDFNKSLQASVPVPWLANMQADMVMHGTHGSPMRGRLANGRQSVWAAGDLGRQDHDPFSGNIDAGEFGYARGIADGVTLKLAVGRTYSGTSTVDGGSAMLRGTYALPELIAAIPRTPLYGTLSFYYNGGEADVKRGYLNAGTPAISRGTPGMEQSALRLRLDWLNAFQLGKTDFTPYASMTWYRDRIDGYTETGGGFPVQWHARTLRSSQARLGVDGVYPLTDRIRLLGRVEGVHRSVDSGNNASGQILGLSGFDLAGPSFKRDWLRAGLGAEGEVGPGVASVMVNGTTEGSTPSAWIYASYRMIF